MPVAIVTGSSGGIGRGIALRLADDGFDVVVNDIAPKQANIDAVVAEINAKGKNAVGIAADVSNKEQVQALVSGAVEKFGALNVMVANAGILETTPLLELSVEQWDRSMAINLRGVFLCIQTSALQFINQGGGSQSITACSISRYRTNALGQELFPENIAGLVSFLAGKDSSHMTGQSIICDGGGFINF